MFQPINFEILRAIILIGPVTKLTPIKLVRLFPPATVEEMIDDLQVRYNHLIQQRPESNPTEVCEVKYMPTVMIRADGQDEVALDPNEQETFMKKLYEMGMRHAATFPGSGKNQFAQTSRRTGHTRVIEFEWRRELDGRIFAKND
ncbi:hypothetical protein PtA15_3A314 [Puccinia triticina]|uniref:Uncharacterized protein n=1 Tax=Puccinia triticina TaxID=208348 RepID=A0ABY7CEZ8_9BASI|nr:uncharacterized protein PtA15_3A314 [Puccinia triticina]WAQ82948.1 hypothetical protein PtA15_3A314 [Puccinia triticina]